MLLEVLIAAGLITIVAFFVLNHFKIKAEAENERILHRKMLLVVAHPDDESMFFVPTCSSFGPNKRILCLSNGNYEGLGKIRETELHVAATSLGFQSVQFGDFPDGPKQVWDTDKIASLVESQLEDGTIIVTFDEVGISSHPNHIAAYEGVRKLVTRRPELLAYKLVSDKSLFIKYTGTWGATIHCLFFFQIADDPLYLINDNPFNTYIVMAAHQSQFVWYRFLFILFAKCAQMNILTRIK
jgi:N-acetylglucosaminylphosphatidylinositol deacetylase